MLPMPATDRGERLANLAPLVVNELVAEGKNLVERGVLANIYDGLILREGTFIIQLDEAGQLVGIKDIREERTITVKEKNKLKEKTVFKKVPMEVPYCRKHSNAADDAHLGADNAQFLLGLKDEKVSDKQFQASAELHTRVLKDVDTPLARAICRFFATWDPATAGENEILSGMDKEQGKAFFQSNYLIFGLVNGPHEMEDVKIREKFKEYFWEDINNAPGTRYGTSYISGEENVPLADLFGSISGVSGAQSSGASPTSWGSKSEASTVNYMGLRRGENYPVSKIEAILYLEALNYLLSDRRHYRLMPNGCYKVFWTDASDTGDVANTALGMSVFGASSYIYDTPEDELIAHAVGCMMNASPNTEDFAELAMRSGVRFFTLNVKGNSARLQLTHFECGTFGDAMNSVYQHVMDTSLVSARKEDAGALRTFAFQTLLRGLERKKSIAKDGTYKPSLHPIVYDEILESILSNRKYPEFVGRRVISLVAFDKYLSQERVALMRGYLLRNGKVAGAKEAASTPFLNVETDFQPYVLGRVFSTLLNIQNEASNFPGTDIADRYFGQMLSHPENALPQLFSLSIRHLHKLSRDPKKRAVGRAYEKELTSLMDRVAFPIDRTLQIHPEGQMAFCLGFKMAQWFHFMPKDVKRALVGEQGQAYHAPGLQPEEDNPAYLMGRLLYVCEGLQAKTNPMVQYTVRDEYFGQSINCGGAIIQYAAEKAPNYVKKLLRSPDTKGVAIWYSQKINDLVARLQPADSELTRDTMSKVNVALGYFHERANQFRSKEHKAIDAELASQKDENSETLQDVC